MADGGNPLKVLECLNVSLVGPFEYLRGDLDSLSDEQLLTHYRYYFDLPEFQTIMVQREDADHIHYGYWRDDPEKNPVGICKSKGGRVVLESAGKNTKWIEAVACNLFDFTKERIEQIRCHHPEPKTVSTLSEAVDAFVDKHGIETTQMGDEGCPFKRRSRGIVTPTFHRFGLVVKMENDIGYRPIGYSNVQLKRILKRMNADKQHKRKVNAEEMEVVLTNVCLADDEGDPGMGYELGIDFFYSYPMFAKKAQRLLSNAYRLTDRDGFIPILKAHLKTRETRKDPCSHWTGNSILRYTKKQNGKKSVPKGNSKMQKSLDELSSDEAEQ